MIKNKRKEYDKQTALEELSYYLENEPCRLYSSGIVIEGGYCDGRQKGYVWEDCVLTEVIADAVLLHGELTGCINDANYTIGGRKKIIDKLREELDTPDKRWEYINKKSHGKGDSFQIEPKMGQCFCVQRKIGDYDVVDYQVPIKNRSGMKIDLVLKKEAKLYIVEFKKFKSSESLLRCVLEIITYYQSLNKSFSKIMCEDSNLDVIPVVMVDSTSYAFDQYKPSKSNEKVLELMDKYNVRFFELVKDDHHIFTINDITHQKH